MIHVQTNMGWRRLVGSIKLQVSFAKGTCKRDYILQKRPIIVSILLTVATPKEEVDTYINDPKCGFLVTNQHWYALVAF